MPCNTSRQATTPINYSYRQIITVFFLSALVNLHFHPVDGICIFVSFHGVGIIQLPGVGPLLPRKMFLTFQIVFLILTLLSFFLDLVLWSGEAKIICFALESFLPEVFRIDFGGLDWADFGFGVSTLLIVIFFSFLCLKYRFQLIYYNYNSSLDLKIFSITLSPLEPLEDIDVEEICLLKEA